MVLSGLELLHPLVAFRAKDEMSTQQQQQLSLLDILDTLRGIWKYSATGLWTKNGGKKHPDEYILVLIRLWDYLDTIPVSTIESILVELEGRKLWKAKSMDKILHNQISYYLECRNEQG